jgi:hypothetical protein
MKGHSSRSDPHAAACAHAQAFRPAWINPDDFRRRFHSQSLDIA